MLELTQGVKISFSIVRTRSNYSLFLKLSIIVKLPLRTVLISHDLEEARKKLAETETELG